MFVVTKPGEIPPYSHDPQAVLDYPIDWTPWLTDVNDSIASAYMKLDGVDAPTLPHTGDIILQSMSSDAMTTTVWIDGNNAPLDSDYEVTHHIVTLDGREEDQTILIQIRKH